MKRRGEKEEEQKDSERKSNNRGSIVTRPPFLIIFPGVSHEFLYNGSL